LTRRQTDLTSNAGQRGDQLTGERLINGQLLVPRTGLAEISDDLLEADF